MSNLSISANDESSILNPLPADDSPALPYSISQTDLDGRPAFEVLTARTLHTKDKSHVFFYIGHYEFPDGRIIPHAIVQASTANKKDTVVIQPLSDVKDPYMYAELNYLEHDMSYSDTQYGPWVVME